MTTLLNINHWINQPIMQYCPPIGPYKNRLAAIGRRNFFPKLWPNKQLSVTRENSQIGILSNYCYFSDIFKMDELDYNSSEDDSVESRAGDTDMELGDLSEDEGDLTPGDVVEEDGREAEHDGEN